MKIDDTGFQFDYQSGYGTKYPWSIVHSVKGDGNCLVMLTEAGSVFVPRSILNSETTNLIYALVHERGALSDSQRAL